MLGSSRIIALSLGCTLLLLAGQAQCLEAVRPIPGYVCMSLIPEDQLVTVQSELPPVLAAPSPTAALVGYPSAIVFVKWPLHEAAGYVEMLRLNGQRGWIAASHLRPWRPLNNTNAKCVPSFMSDGGLGTSIR